MLFREIIIETVSCGVIEMWRSQVSGALYVMACGGFSVLWRFLGLDYSSKW